MKEYEKSVIENIKNKYEELFSAEKRVAEYILKNPDEIVMLNISELAKKSGSSEATVVRTCKHVGYQGYYQMRLLISHDLGKTKRKYVDGELLDSSKHIFDFCADRISKLSNFIDMETLIEAVKVLKMSRMVFIVGAGNTTPIATDLGFRLERFGIPCSYSVIPEHFLNHVSLGTSEDTIIAISRTGASKQVVQALELAKKKHMKIIVISGEVETQMANDADYMLCVMDKRSCWEPDSHLLEMAVNDALLYIVQNSDLLVKNVGTESEQKAYSEDVELLLSEYKL